MGEVERGVEEFPLRPGDEGPAVVDLQRRLQALDLAIDPAERGSYGVATAAMVAAFQERSGLLSTGECDRSTWSALVEAGYELGDRLLYHRRPMLRGDDVTDLQLRLSSLGFHAGRVDGIFGPDTERALVEFQRNTGLTTDAVCGPDVVAALTKLGARQGFDTNVAGVRERERLRATPRVLHRRRIAVGDHGGVDAISSVVVRRLREAGATVLVHHHPDPSVQAAESNAFDAEAYLGIALQTDASSTISYYASGGFVSIGGQWFAELVSAELGALDGLAPEVKPLRIAVLRETRMPAVMCLLGPPELVVSTGQAVGEALARAVTRWVEHPVETSD